MFVDSDDTLAHTCISGGMSAKTYALQRISVLWGERKPYAFCGWGKLEARLRITYLFVCVFEIFHAESANVRTAMQCRQWSVLGHRQCLLLEKGVKGKCLNTYYAMIGVA